MRLAPPVTMMSLTFSKGLSTVVPHRRGARSQAWLLTKNWGPRSVKSGYKQRNLDLRGSAPTYQLHKSPLSLDFQELEPLMLRQKMGHWLDDRVD